MRRDAGVVAGAATFALVTFAYRYLSFTEFSNDHFVHLSIAQQITRGALPVRDFVERGIPLMSMASAGAQIALGEGLRSELVLIAAAFAASAALVFGVAVWLSRSMLIATLATTIPVLAYPVSYSYPKLLAPALACAASGLYAARPSTTSAALIGLAIATSFLFRHDLGIFVGIGVVAMLVAYHGWSGEGIVNGGRVVVGVAVLAVSPYLIWVQVHEGLATYIADGMAFSAREAQRANWWWEAPHFGVDRSRPLMTRFGRGPVVNVRWQPDASDASISEAEIRHGLTRLDPNSPRSWQYELSHWSRNDIARLVTDPLAADTNGIDRSTFDLQVPAPGALRAWVIKAYWPGDGLRLGANLVVLMFYFLWLAPLAAVIVLSLTWKQTPAPARALAVSLVVLQLAMNVTMLRDPLETRLRDVLVPLALLVSYLGGTGWRIGDSRARRVTMRIAVIVVLVVIAGSAGALGAAWTQIERTRIADGLSGLSQRARTLRRTLAPPDHRTGRRLAMYEPIVDYVKRCTTGDARVLTLTFAPELFFYTGRAFAGGQVSLSPGYFSSDRDTSLLLARVSRENVPLVIMDSQTEREMFDTYRRIGDYVQARYLEAVRFPVNGEKSWVVFAAQQAPSWIVLAGQRVPCFA